MLGFPHTDRARILFALSLGCICGCDSGMVERGEVERQSADKLRGLGALVVDDINKHASALVLPNDAVDLSVDDGANP